MRTLLLIGFSLILACSTARDSGRGSTGYGEASGAGGSGASGGGEGGSGADAATEGDSAGSADDGGEASGGAATGSSGSTGGGSGGDGEEGGGVRLDVASSGEDSAGGEGPGTVGCTRLDLVFVLDNSTSMAAEQARLQAAFPALLSEIGSTISADLHVMVVSTDADLLFGPVMPGPPCSGANCACEVPTGCCETVCTEPAVTSCYGFPCAQSAQLEECDLRLGAGRRFAIDGTVCGLTSGQRYLTGDNPMAADVFTCLSGVGTYGEGNEAPIEVLRAALEQSSSLPGGCNGDFLRADALLAVVLVTDEEDNAKSREDPEQWHAAVVDAKAGDENAVVLLGLLGDGDLADGTCAPLVAEDGAEPSPRLRAFFDGFPRAMTAPVCADDYAPIFATWVHEVDLACDSFLPPGG